MVSFVETHDGLGRPRPARGQIFAPKAAFSVVNTTPVLRAHAEKRDAMPKT